MLTVNQSEQTKQAMAKKKAVGKGGARKGAGRKELPPGVKRTHAIPLRVREWQWHDLEKRAALVDMPITRYIERVLWPFATDD